LEVVASNHEKHDFWVTPDHFVQPIKNTLTGISTNPSIKDFHVWEQLAPIDPLGVRVAERDSISNSCSLSEES